MSKTNREDDFVSKNFLLVSLEERKAKKIAEVLNNDTARKIIDFLATKDATETDISKELKIAISTVHYNLKQLQEAGIVVTEEFHYSQKGKEVNHYTLANKYIIITPKNEDPKFLEALKKIMPLGIITAVVAVVMQLFTLLNNNATSVPIMAAKTAMVQDNAEAAGANLMAAAPEALEVARPALQSSPVAYFLVGALVVIFIYFIYEFTRKK
jgi:DNA-binding transcriptional ArsR family regulator